MAIMRFRSSFSNRVHKQEMKDNYNISIPGSSLSNQDDGQKKCIEKRFADRKV